MSARRSSAAAEHGFTFSRHSAQKGFTLIELLVALAVFSLAAVALLRLDGIAVRSAAILESRAVGQVVARNVAVEALSDPVTPPLGTVTGEEANAGRQWRWTRAVKLMPDPRLQQIEVSVTDEAGDPAGALTVFRRVAS